jgi:hypothetical protein
MSAQAEASNLLPLRAKRGVRHGPADFVTRLYRSPPRKVTNVGQFARRFTNHRAYSYLNPILSLGLSKNNPPGLQKAVEAAYRANRANGGAGWSSNGGESSPSRLNCRHVHVEEVT